MTATPTIVQFDKHFQSGLLAGLTIPGETCSYPDYRSAQRHAALLERCVRDDDFLREYGSGNQYTVSNVQLFPASP